MRISNEFIIFEMQICISINKNRQCTKMGLKRENQWSLKFSWNLTSNRFGCNKTNINEKSADKMVNIWEVECEKSKRNSAVDVVQLSAMSHLDRWVHRINRSNHHNAIKLSREADLCGKKIIDYRLPILIRNFKEVNVSLWKGSMTLR